MLTQAQRDRKRELERFRRENNTNRTSRPGALGHPFVPAHLLVTLLQPLIDQIGISAVANLSPNIGHRGLLDIRNGNRTYVRFDTADRIICEVLNAPFLWWEIPELRAIYEGGTTQ